MQRNRNIAYDDDDLYDDAEDDETADLEYSQEDRDNFATLTPVVRAELQEAGLQASDREVEDALYHYYWDVGKSVSYLKNTKQPKQEKQQDGKKEKGKPKSRFEMAAEKSALVCEDEINNGGGSKSKPATNGLAKKTEALKLDSTPSAPAQPKIKSKGLDVPKLWAEQSSKRKPSTAFAVIGHVDHGKSTLMGRLLLDTGAVSQRDIDKYKKQATELGKSSFALAWVMDTGSEERERGVTVDIAQHHFSTSTTDFTILDAPGHRDFVPNMIGGASMADLAVLVVDANQLESGMKGQTKEHILLAKACGISRVVVAVNKMDSIASEPWSQGVFQQVSAEVMKLLTDTGFAKEDVQIVPCSGLGGENVAKPASKDGPTAWIASDRPTLLQALENSTSQAMDEGQVKAPLRMQITDVFRGGIQNPLSVSGRLSSGSIQVGDATIVQPSGETAAIKGIEVAGEGKDWAVSGQMCTLHLTEIDAQHLRSGDMLCSATKPVPVLKSFEARIQALDSLLPQGVDVHIGRLHVPGRIGALVQTVDAKGDVLRRKPRVVKEGQRAVVRIALDEGAPVEVGARLVLRSNGTTVAAGRVE